MGIYNDQLHQLYKTLNSDQIELVRVVVLNSIRRAVKNGVITDEQYDTIKDLWEREDDQTLR